jgi:hypothetical protein
MPGQARLGRPHGVPLPLRQGERGYGCVCIIGLLHLLRINSLCKTAQFYSTETLSVLTGEPTNVFSLYIETNAVSSCVGNGQLTQHTGVLKHCHRPLVQAPIVIV